MKSNTFLAFIQQNKARLLPFGVVLFLVIATIFTLTVARNSQELRSKAVTYSGTLSFSPNTISVAPGQTFPSSIGVNLSTGNQTIVGADVIVSFDQTKLSLTGITKETHATFQTYAPVDTNGNFDTARVISTANSTGRVEFGIVSFDWLANGGQGALTTAFNGTFAPLSRLTFQARPGVTGNTTITYVYSGQGGTTDSNIVHNPTTGDPEDILLAPTSTVVVTFATTASPSPTPLASPSPTLLPSPTIQPSPSACIAATCFDFNGNGTVDIQDITVVANRYLAQPGNPAYDVRFDLNCPQGRIDILDITLVANRMGLASCPR